MTTPMDTSDSGAAGAVAAAVSTLAVPIGAAAASSASASSGASAAGAAAAGGASKSSPAPSPQPTHADEEAEDVLINDDTNFDEDDLMDDKKAPARARKSNAAAAASSTPPGDALERLNELLKRTEQFAKFVPTSAPSKKKGKGRHGSGGAERREEEEEDKELVQDELEQADGAKSWPDHLDEQPTSVVKAGGLPMRQYQLEALNWLIKLHDQNLNGILADEMGLGKTLESLSLLAYLKQYRNYAGPHLILVPKSTSSNWMREVNRWTNNLTAFKFHGNQEERDAAKPEVMKHDIIVTTYEMVIREKGFFAKIKWKYIYIDEAHRIKNENSLLSRVVRTFNAEHRLLITGTPLQNNLHELWALLNFLVPSLFHSSDDFAEWFNLEGNDQRAEIVARLHRMLRPFLLRRLKSDVEKALLPKIETKLFVGMSAMQKQWYKKILERDIEVLNATNTSKVRLLNIVMQLRKVCNHPYLFQGAEPGPPYLEGEHIVENSSKMVLLDKLLTKLEKGGHRVLIFSQMTRILDILEDYTRYRGYDYCRIDGQTKQEDRDEAMEVFNAPNSKKFVFLLSTRAGGLGINLQTADTVILFDSDWNPQMDLQAMDRAHRIGQKKQVTVFRFVVEHSIEQKMVERATKKLFLDALVIKQGRLNDAEKVVSAQELQDMVRFGANRIFQGADAETITDADIDMILARGTEMTKNETEKLKQNAGNDLLNFSLTDEAKTNFQMFEGKDYTGFRGAAGFEFIEPAKRERKSNYDINAYYRDALKTTDGTGKKKQSTKEWKPALRYDFQFFDEERLNVLEKKQFESNLLFRKMKLEKQSKEREERRIREEREKDERRKARYAKMRADRLAAQAAGQTLPDAKEEDMKDLDSDDEGAAPAASAAAPAALADGAVKMEIDGQEPAKSADAAAEVKIKVDGDVVMKTEDDPTAAGAAAASSSASRKSSRSNKSSPAPSPLPPSNGDEEEEAVEEATNEEELEIERQMKELAGCLTAAEEEELHRLQSEGFGKWSRRHIISLTKAMEKFGRKDLPNIRMHVDEMTPEEVDAYYPVFWQRYKELKNWDQIIKAVERGEARLKKQEEYQRVIDEKVRRYRGNFEKMSIPYPTNTQKTFTEEEDKFLVIQMHRLGFGAWEDLKSCIRSSWMFRFDWFFKSRTTAELSKRVEYLLKLLEKEQEGWAEERKEAEKKRRAKILKAAQQAMASTDGLAAGSSASATDSPQKKKPKKERADGSDDESSTKKKKKSEKSAAAASSSSDKKHKSSSDASKKEKKEAKKEKKESKKEHKEHKHDKKEHKEKKEKKRKADSDGDDDDGGEGSNKKKEHKKAKKEATAE